MSEDAPAENAGADLRLRLEELRQRYEPPKPEAAMLAAWDAIDPDAPITAPLPKIAWLRLLDAVEAAPTLSIQAATFAVLLGNGQAEAAQALALQMAEKAFLVQKNMQAVRTLLMSLALEGHAVD